MKEREGAANSQMGFSAHTFLLRTSGVVLLDGSGSAEMLEQPAADN